MLGRHELVSSILAGRLQRMIEARIGVRGRPQAPEVQYVPQLLEAPHLVGSVQCAVVLAEELLMPLRRQ